MNILKWIDTKLEEYILIGTLSYIALLTIVQVFMRYVIGQSLYWSEESIRFVFIWMIFMGFGMGVRDNKHISIVMIRDLLPNKFNIFFNIISRIAFLIYSIAGVYFGVQVVVSFFDMSQNSPALGIPMYFIYLAAPVGFTITTVRLIQSLINLFKKQKRGI